jgi:uncharacterized protein YutE (UPF0331/DUF86 family)
MEAHDIRIRERILQKMEVLIDRIEFIERHLSDAVVSDRILRKALYKEFQEAVEAATDICARPPDAPLLRTGRLHQS